MTQPGPQGPDAAATQHVFVTPPVTLIRGWVPSTTRCVSVTQPGPQGPDAAATWRVSVTPPATLPGGWAPSTTRCVSVTPPGPHGLGVGTTRRVLVTPTKASGSGNRVGLVSYGCIEEASDQYPQGIGVTKMLTERSDVWIIRSQELVLWPSKCFSETFRGLGATPNGCA